ncbi:MAG: sialidase [Acidobacteriota bacterium]|nr:sialidase [Acidobacteriota bacterium]
MMFSREQFRRNSLLILGVFVLVATGAFIAAGQQFGRSGFMRSRLQPRSGTIPEDLSALDWRFVGPPGNRISAVVFDSNDPNIYYAGACAGGVWKSIDGGTEWRPVFDDQTSQSIGSLAIAPSDSNQVWAGTGEAFIRSNVLIGDGIYKSTDAGLTWTRMGLEKSGRIGRIAVDPHDPNTVFAAALGHSYGPQKERGVFRTKDGGKTWEHVLFIDENTGASGLVIDPNNPRTIFAGMWSIVIHTWGKFSGGPGSGVYVSRDGGDTWTKIQGRGLPGFDVGKVDVAVAPSDSNRVYALIETGDRGTLWRSDDHGHNWRVVSYERRINERPHYYTRMCIAPDDPNTVYFPCNRMYVTYDGGESIDDFSGGGDCHDMWADPKNPERMMIGHDGGISMTTTRGRQWRRIVLPVGQMYHVAVDDRIPYFVYSNMQDSTSKRGPAYPGYGPEPPIWISMGGCESGFSYPDPADPDIVWGTCYSGTVEVYNLRTGLVRSVNPWPDKSLDSPAENLKYRWNWTHPIALSPHDSKRVYVGSQYVHLTTDGGRNWSVISPDLTLNDKSKQGSSGGLSKDNLGVEYGCTLFAIAESPVQEGLIWVGSNDGLIHVSRDFGKTWTNVTPSAMPHWGTVSMIDPSRFDAGRCYIAVDGHQENIRDPYLFKTLDFGKTWTRIDAGIPRSPLSYTSAIKEDPVRKGLLFAGTANAIYFSIDDGASWLPLQANLPQACITWIAVQERFGDLVVGTNGRGIWIMDDISPLREYGKGAGFLKPRPAWRFKPRERVVSFPGDPSIGRGGPYGASLNFFLDEDAGGGARIEIFDERGTKFRTLRSPARRGLNRINWNLRGEAVAQIELRTTPDYHPRVWEEKRFRGRDTRPVSHWGIQQPLSGILAPPGLYTVRLTVAGKSHERTLEVLKDPNTQGTVDDIRAMTHLWAAALQDLNEVVSIINRIEWAGRQMEDLRKVLSQAKGGRIYLDALTETHGRLRDVERLFLEDQMLASDPKSYREEMALYQKLVWFIGEVGLGAGDIRNTEDFGPTSQQLEVYEILKKRFADGRAAFNALINTTIPAFNTMLADAGLGPVIANF